ncbi:methyl-coenzyme M reductase operon protein D [Methanoregula formicica]|uniref:Methyl-coenzyme M reductase operon protein D n=1 Tax=Methanoregula formicica (strain DSM 22288 / NBRC 105244 / SMSP) TaxID=593750 RepID=L0HF34_METFS|nr:methyl-coenzyme M reductase operon protein D [Methanoregula formicica]AGB01928.1 methyl-coenzyme M reductase operon protein D [Methanoregula formicica SMSP]
MQPDHHVYPQCRIVPMRLLSPDTTKRLLERIVPVPGIRRMLLNGQNIPVVVPYGPARGTANKTNLRKSIEIAGNTVDLHVQVGTITLEVEDKSVIAAIRAICDNYFVNFPCSVQEGRFMKTRPSLVDYAKYGPEADPSVIGLVDPKRKEKPAFISPLSDRVSGGCEL